MSGSVHRVRGRPGLGLRMGVLGAALAYATCCPPPAIAQGVADGDWTMPARDYANTRFSPLDQLTPQNVKSLKLAWTFSTAVGLLLVAVSTYVVGRTTQWLRRRLRMDDDAQPSGGFEVVLQRPEDARHARNRE